MKTTDLTLSRFIPGPIDEVFDVWFDPARPGGPWHDAKKAIMNLTVDGMFYFGIDQEVARAHLRDLPSIDRPGGLLGHFGRFTVID